MKTQYGTVYEQMKEDGDVLALTVGWCCKWWSYRFMSKESVDLFQHLYYQQKYVEDSERMVTERCGSKDHHSRTMKNRDLS